MASLLGMQNSSEENQFGCPSVAGSRALRFCPVYNGVSSVYTRDAKCPGDCGSGVFIAQEIDGV
jgi:ribosomal protein S27AE